MSKKTDAAPLNKNDDIVITIDDLGSNGEGIGHYEGFAVFVTGALPGEQIKTHIIKVTAHYAIGIIVEILKASLQRIEPSCSSFPKCGGCHLQHLSYEAELKYKQNKILSCLQRIGGVDILSIPEVKNCPNWEHYRNKAQFPIQQDENGIKAGFFASRSHRIVEMPKDGCVLQDEKANQLIHEIVDEMNRIQESIYDENTHKGLIRHVLIRTLEQISVTFVVSSNNFKNLSHWQLFFKDRFISFSVNVQPKDDNVILGPKMLLEEENKTIGDIGALRFYIAPQSFFQVNQQMTYELYQTALEFANLQESDDVLDLYCGVGTLSLFMAQKAHQVIGIEIVPQAIENAQKNALLNNLHNAKFFCGSCEEVTEKIVKTEDFHPSVVMVDPPRSGCDSALIEFLAKLNLNKIVYVSCDPATLARDINLLSKLGGYKLEKVQGVDMFPRTIHVETVCLLTKNK